MKSAISNNSLNDTIYYKIKEDIMNLTLEPGTGVSVQKLALHYGVSRTPVREAFVRLQKEGLLEIQPKKKTIVSKIDLKRVREEWIIRRSLELSITDQFINNCNKIIEEEINNIIMYQKQCMDMEYYKEFYNYDNNLHKIIFNTANVNLAWNTIEEVDSHYNRLRILSSKMDGISQHIIEEHEGILNAVKKRDVQNMKDIQSKHLSNIFGQIEGMVKKYPNYFTNIPIRSTVDERRWIYADDYEVVWQ